MAYQPPYVIIIAGTTGSGKSTVGKELSKQIGYEFIDGDDFHTEENKMKMGRGEPLNDNDRNPWLELLAIIWEKNPDKKLVIACSALKRKYRGILIGENPDESRKIVLLKVPKETLKTRLDNRKMHFARSDLIESQLATLELPERRGDEPNLIVLDGTQTINEIISEIMAKLNLGHR